MRLLQTIFSLCVLSTSSLHAQPVITANDFLHVGDTASQVRYQGPIDVSAFTAAGPTGAWDFTALSGSVLFEDTIDCLLPSAGSVDPAIDFAGAGRVVRLTSTSPGLPPAPPMWDYYSYGADERTYYGSVIDGPPALSIVFSPPTSDTPFPLVLGETWVEDYEFALFTSLNRLHIESSVDAWGPATLPGIGTVDCLRATRETTNQIFDTSSGSPILIATFHTRSYIWYAVGIDIVAILASPEDPLAVPAAGFATANFAQLFTDHTRAASGALLSRGDIDANGALDLGDAIRMLDHLLGAAEPPCLAAADFDDDGTVEMDDAVSLLTHLFLEGLAPAAPYPDCGADPTPDLSCTIECP